MAKPQNTAERRHKGGDLKSGEHGKVCSVDAQAWAGFPGSHGYEFKSVVDDAEYTNAFSSELVRVGPVGRSEPHIERYNHALFILKGSGQITIGDESWSIHQGSLAKVRAGERHSLRNLGSDEMLMLAIYDPPRRHA